MRLRLLPIVIVIAGLAISTRLGALWVDVAAFAQADNGEPVTAPTTSGEAEPQGEADDAATMAAGGEESEDDQAAASEPQAGEQPATADFQKTVLSPDPFALTDTDIDLLQELAQRREELGQRARRLDQREALLAAAESRLDQKVAALEALKGEIERLVTEQDQRNDEQIASLVRIYETMKPKQAATIMEGLDLEVVIAVIGQMKERKSATILAQMDAQKAQEITLKLANRNELPIPRE